MFDQIANDQAQSAIGQVDLIAFRAAGFTREPIEQDEVFDRARLKQMSHACAVRPIVAKVEPVDDIDVKIVRLTIARTIVGEFTLLNGDGAAGHRVGQDAVLIVTKQGITHREIAALLSNPGAIGIDGARAAELDVLD